MAGKAVKVTLAPVQIELTLSAKTYISGLTTVSGEIIRMLLVAVIKLAQAVEPVMTQDMELPSPNALLAYVVLFVPTSVPLSFH